MARIVVGVPLRQRERGGEQARFLVSELQIRGTDRAQPEAGGGRIAVRAPYPGDARGHPVSQLAHGRRGDRGEELVTAGEVPVRGVGHDTHHPGRLAEHHGVRAAGSGQLEPGGDQPSRTAPRGRRRRSACSVPPSVRLITTAG